MVSGRTAGLARQHQLGKIIALFGAEALVVACNLNKITSKNFQQELLVTIFGICGPLRAKGGIFGLKICIFNLAKFKSALYSLKFDKLGHIHIVFSYKSTIAGIGGGA